MLAALRAAEAATTDSRAVEKEVPAASVKTDAVAGGEGGATGAGTGGAARAGAAGAAAGAAGAGAGAVVIVDSARIWASSFSHCR